MKFEMKIEIDYITTGHLENALPNEFRSRGPAMRPPGLPYSVSVRPCITDIAPHWKASNHVMNIFIILSQSETD